MPNDLAGIHSSVAPSEGHSAVSVEAIRAVHEFLDAFSDDLESHESSDVLAARLERLQKADERSADQLRRLEIANCSLKLDYRLVREAFLRHARDYSLGKGVSYREWVDAGISQRVLRDAGITSRLAMPAPAGGPSS